MRAKPRAAALKAAGTESAAVIGFTSAIGACGGYVIPRAFGASIARRYLALEVFLLFYATCVAVTWWYYLRRSLFAQRSPTSLAEAWV
ncbi:MAG TPA: hypothetical protein VNV18_16145 [Stellaceae bacterium]|nr:hypothetical protein [Stellaceae bacterium]